MLAVAAAPAAVVPRTTSAPTLAVPADFAATLDSAVAQGRADALQFGSEHVPAERDQVADWALLRLGFPPKDDAPELQYLHGVARTRTPDGVAAARYWAEHGLTSEWEALLEDYTRAAGPAQARAARALLHDALMLVNTATQVGKGSSLRKRPFVVDPSLKLAVDRPGNSPSFPSGHTSAATAAGMVLAHLMPDRADEFLGMARQASWARVYAGVHFPSDVAAGAKLASTIVSHLTATSTAAPRTGTASTNPGVAGTRRRLPGAVQLPGTPITGSG